MNIINSNRFWCLLLCHLWRDKTLADFYIWWFGSSTIINVSDYIQTKLWKNFWRDKMLASFQSESFLPSLKGQNAGRFLNFIWIWWFGSSTIINVSDYIQTKLWKNSRCTLALLLKTGIARPSFDVFSPLWRDKMLASFQFESFLPSLKGQNARRFLNFMVSQQYHH